MLARTFSAVMQGLQPVKIEVEVDSTIGTPQFLIIGLPTKEIDEAKERITAALINCGIRIRAKRTIVNLAPADVRKTGSGLELAIAVGLFCLLESTEADLTSTMFFGELSLDGAVKPIRGALPLVLAASAMGFSSVVLPEGNSAEVSSVSGIAIHPVGHLSEVIESLRMELPLATQTHVPFVARRTVEPEVDFRDIIGQSMAKRALEIAAAGGHNLLLVGPPGTGKSLLAQSLPGILPPLSEKEATEISSIYSVAGLLDNQQLIRDRPFRTPHHSTSIAGLTGGGVPIIPGEISLAHTGVLFMDEIPEFPRVCLESLRQPLEQRTITITRASGSYHFPARFSLIAAANPCPCGYFGSSTKACRCSRSQRRSYHNRLSGPLLDRIDLFVWASEVPIAAIARAQAGVSSSAEPSRVIAARVDSARKLQHERHEKSHKTNSELSTKEIKQFALLSKEAKLLLAKAGRSLNLSARSYNRTIKVARTIADLGGSEQITQTHLAEALQFRARIWGVE